MHARSAAAGYAAVYAYREQLKGAGGRRRRRPSGATPCKLAPLRRRLPGTRARRGGSGSGRRRHVRDAGPRRRRRRRPGASSRPTPAEAAIRRSAWIVMAHGSFELAEYPQAEHAYARCWRSRRRTTSRRAELVDNLAASIYKQGELANEAQDYRAAADHFLRIRFDRADVDHPRHGRVRRGRRADAAGGLDAAAGVLEAFRAGLPRARAAARGHQADRPSPTGKAASCRTPPRSSTHRCRVGGSGPAQRGPAGRRRSVRAVRCPGSGVDVYIALCRTSFRSRSKSPSRPVSRSPRSTRSGDEGLYHQELRKSSASTRTPGRRGPCGPGRSPHVPRWSSPSASTRSS